MDVQPFSIQTPDSSLTDLRNRLTNTRWPDEIDNSAWSYGASLGYMKEIGSGHTKSTFFRPLRSSR